MTPTGWTKSKSLFVLAFAGALVILSSFSCRAQTIKNLTMGPCNSHGIPYCGALTEMDRQGHLLTVERVAGEHGGAIPATLLAIGYSANEVSDIMRYTDFHQFQEGASPTQSEIFPIPNREIFKSWLESHIARKTGSGNTTFIELHKNKSRWKGFDLFIASELEGHVLSYETTPGMAIAEAVLHSYTTKHDFAAPLPDHDDNTIVGIFDEAKYYNELTIMGFEDEFRNPQTLGLIVVCDQQKKAPLVDASSARELLITCNPIDERNPPAFSASGKTGLIDLGSMAVLDFYSGHSAK